MGVWGTGIYSSDIAEDVKDACKEVYALYDVGEGNELMFKHFNDVLEQGFVDNEYASFWYALADWQWKHGMLNEFVKEQTLSLLDSYAGIEEWQEDDQNYDCVKRQKVLDSLKEQLLTQQPCLKKPKFSYRKPKHKVGDIVIFQSSSNDESNWKIDTFKPPFIYKSLDISNSRYEDVIEYNAQGKYMALLCVATEKELHSEYIPNVYDEYSVYVWYDYLSNAEPKLEELEQCGFLPFIDIRWEDFNRNKIGSAEWIYKFTLCSESFQKGNELQNCIKNSLLSEVTRFNDLLFSKKYSCEIWGGFDLSSMFDVAFEEKCRMEMLGIKIDNLLNLDVINPEILPSNELKNAFKEYIKGMNG